MKVSLGIDGVNEKVEVDFRGRTTGRIYTRVLKDTEAVRVCERGDPYRKPRAGDGVLCSWHKTTPDSKEEPLDINVIYPHYEEVMLALRGISFPEVPPDLNPNGYYG